ncbi:hypothetical protein HPB50_026295 [Hyalomma asiaticum]|uniref:Uncharacterized protein n=1 Tax=Hyalomma asiaticum TaxID=266040 RepID=A0ACB7TPQ3_HYAAI|nr:hypothetical protein HPB50_026295 [Hyalomma asiaticum]
MHCKALRAIDQDLLRTVALLSPLTDDEKRLRLAEQRQCGARSAVIFGSSRMTSPPRCFRSRRLKKGAQPLLTRRQPHCSNGSRVVQCVLTWLFGRRAAAHGFIQRSAGRRLVSMCALHR